MIKSRARQLIKPMAHQLVSLKHDKTTPIVFDMSDPGCVSADTEYLTPTGWKRIDAYTPGDRVAQFHPTTREIEFVEPLGYVKRPCNRMIAIAPARGTSQRLSHEHRVLYYDSMGAHGVCSAAEYMQQLHARGANHLNRKFCTTFSLRNEGVLPLSDAQLRLMVAVIADGHFGGESLRCVIRLKKRRKIEHLMYLLMQCGIAWDTRQCGGSDPSFQVFTFDAPLHDKEFGPAWWGASQKQLEVIADELPHWDSAIDSRPSAGVRFSSFSQASADFAQFAFAAAKMPTSLTLSYRDRTSEGRGQMLEYTVHARAKDAMVGPGRKSSVYEVPNPEGFKYCFEVPSTFLLLRHNGYIFATGNTGKTAVRIWAWAERRRKKAGCMLVLAPRSLLRAAWANDFAKFAPDMKVSVATATNREKAFAEPADVYITNHDAVKWLVKQKAVFWQRFTDGDVVADEGTAYKHHTSQRSRAALKIFQPAKTKVFKHKAVLTATPTSNGICDIWHPMALLDGGERLGSSFYGFRMHVCEPQQVGRDPRAVRWTDKEGAEEAVFGLINDIVIRHRFADCVDIPPTHTYSVNYELTPKQRKVYDDMDVAKILVTLNKGKRIAISAVNASAVAMKLCQIASGAVYDNDKVVQLIDTGRYDAIMDMCEVRKHPLVLFYWKHQRDALVAEAEARSMTYAVLDGGRNDNERACIEAAYQRGEYDVLFGHPKSVAHGFTFTRGTATIWSGPPADLEWWLQGSRRQARIGQKEKTEVIVMLAEGTVEERIYNEILMPKDGRMKNLLDLFTTGGL